MPSPPPAPRAAPSRDPFALPVAVELLPPASACPLRKWEQPDVFDVYVRHRDFKNEFVAKKRGPVTLQRFESHCSRIPLEVRQKYEIDGHAAGRRQQRRTLLRIDDALEDALCFWKTTERD